MKQSPLNGLSILVVEDQPIIAMDISQTFRNIGVHITTTNTLRHAMILAESDCLSAAILDHALGDGNSSRLYERLTERGIPYLIYSGFARADGMPPEVAYLSKPASDENLISATEELVEANPRRLPV